MSGNVSHIWACLLVLSVLFQSVHSLSFCLSTIQHKYPNEQNKPYTFICLPFSLCWRLYSSATLVKLLLVRFEVHFHFITPPLYLHRCSNSMRNTTNSIKADENLHGTKFTFYCCLRFYFICWPEAFQPNYSCLLFPENSFHFVFGCNSLICERARCFCWYFSPEL